MDIDLLSKIIKEIILDNDEVTLPGVGTFVAEVVPSSFSDKGYTINPPYRRLSFRQRDASDTRLVDFYAESNHLDRDAATGIIVRFLAELRQTLESRKTVVFPGLGRLRATRENHFFFVPDEDLSIYPDGFGLEPVSLKTHVETEGELATAMSSLQSILEAQPSPEPVPAAPEAAPEQMNEAQEEQPGVAAEQMAGAQEEQPAGEIPAETAPELPEVEVPDSPAAQTGPVEVREEQPDSVPESVDAEQPAGEAPSEDTEPVKLPERVQESASEPQTVEIRAAAPSAGQSHLHSHGHKTERKTMPKALKLLLWAVAAVVLVFGLFMLLVQVAPDFIDSLLYSEEELQIIHRKWLN